MKTIVRAKNKAQEIRVVTSKSESRGRIIVQSAQSHLKGCSPESKETGSSIHGMSATDLYAALVARDRRFDGQIFVGVSSTRIYCRPICTVRTPQIKNCTFFRTAAAAERGGFRPCLRCRPELAPGSSAPVDAVSRLAVLAIRRIEDGALSALSVDELAAEFGVTARHLRRAIRHEVGLSPVELAQTQRLLLAKQLLTDTDMSVTEAAFASGFESLRRFNTAFRERYRLTPTSLRRSTTTTKNDTVDAYRFALSLRPPFDMTSLLAFWKARATSGVEQVTDCCYRRTVAIGDRRGWMSISRGQKADTVKVLVSTDLGPVLTSVLSRAKFMLDVRADPIGVADCLSEDSLLAPLVERSPGLRLPGAFDGFECGVRAILGQQIGVRAATTLSSRLASRFGKEHATGVHGLTTEFPSAASMARASAAEIQSLGLTQKRSETISGFAKAVANGSVRLDPGADPERVRAGLMAIPGVGPWTVEYILMRAVGWPDAFPYSDLGLIKASGLSVNELRDRSDRWRPWRSYAAMYLWKSLNGLDSARLNTK